MLQGLLASVTTAGSQQGGHYCLQGDHNVRGDPCNTSSLEKIARTVHSSYVPQIPRFQLCVQCLHSVSRCSFDGELFSFSFFNVCMTYTYRVHMFIPACVFLFSTKWTTFRQKKRADKDFFMSKRLHNVILSALCTRSCTHKLGCRWREVPYMHMPYSHCLPPAYSNILWAYVDWQYKYRHTQAHTHWWQPPPPLLSVRWTLSSLKAERQKDRERSVDPVMCVLFTPQPSVSSVSDLPSPQF